MRAVFIALFAGVLSYPTLTIVDGDLQAFAVGIDIIRESVESLGLDADGALGRAMPGATFDVSFAKTVEALTEERDAIIAGSERMHENIDEAVRDIALSEAEAEAEAEVVEVLERRKGLLRELGRCRPVVRVVAQRSR